MSIKRIQDYLILEERDTIGNGIDKNQMEIIETKNNLIEMINVNASWVNDCRFKVLEDLNIHIKPGKLYAILGSVGTCLS